MALNQTPQHSQFPIATQMGSFKQLRRKLKELIPFKMFIYHRNTANKSIPPDIMFQVIPDSLDPRIKTFFKIQNSFNLMHIKPYIYYFILNNFINAIKRYYRIWFIYIYCIFENLTTENNNKLPSMKRSVINNKSFISDLKDCKWSV